jgi:predicted transposase YbfD/YdcC
MGLLDLLRSVPDPRHRRGVRHDLSVILGIGLAAVLAGCCSFAAIGEWAAALTPTALSRLGARAAPTESTIRRAFARLDPEVLDRVIGAWMWTRSTTIGGRRVIAIDGKTVRGARTRTDVAPHLVAVLDHGNGTVVGQLAVAAKSNEIPAVRTLLATFDLVNTVVTLDAMHTQHDTARFIVNAGGDYVLTVKANQPRLRAALKALPWKDVPAYSTVQHGHGRRARRTIKVVTCPDWVDFPGATQVAQLRRSVTRAGTTTVEVVYLVTSAERIAASPAVLASWVQGHWGIENRVHWVRDVTFDEDRSQVRTGHAPHVMATLRNTAISLLRLTGWTAVARALRHHARDPNRPLNLILTC